MENNGIQDAIEELERVVNNEVAIKKQYGDDQGIVDNCNETIAACEINMARLKRAAKALPIEEEVLVEDFKKGKMPSFISAIWNRLYNVVTFRAKMEPPTDIFHTLPATEITQEQAYFTKANNIMEGAWEDTKIEASNWKHIDRYVFPIEIEHRGYMIQAENPTDRETKRRRLDEMLDANIQPQMYYTVDQFQKKFNPAPVLDEEVEKYENDIEFLVQKQMPKTDYSKSTTAHLPLTKLENNGKEE